LEGVEIEGEDEIENEFEDVPRLSLSWTKLEDDLQGVVLICVSK